MYISNNSAVFTLIFFSIEMATDIYSLKMFYMIGDISKTKMLIPAFQANLITNFGHPLVLAPYKCPALSVRYFCLYLARLLAMCVL